jgi:cysteine desulfurase/selenocysteine lyase
MNIKKIRNDFPIFAQHTNPELVFLDSAASAQKPNQVIDAITTFYRTQNANIHRGLYALSEQATMAYEEVREKVARLINAQSSSEIIFTKGTTEGINFIASAWAENHLKAGDEILLSHTEHHANLLPWQRVAQKTGAVLKFIHLNQSTFLLEAHDELVNARTKLVAVTISSNVLGDVWPTGSLEKIITKAKNVQAKVLLDAAQVVGHQPVDIQKLGADFMVFSGHKMLGPTGVGILYINQNLHDKVEPYQLGGSMVYEVEWERATWAQAPTKFEAGTPPIAEVIGLGATIDYITQNINFDTLATHYGALSTLLINGLQQLEEINIYGNIQKMNQEGHVVSFNVNGIHSHDIAAYLASKNIALRAGHHCAQPLIRVLNVDAVVRASFAAYTTTDEVQALINHLPGAIKLLKN